MKKILIYKWSAYNYLDIKKHFELMGFETEEMVYKLENYDEDEKFSKLLSDKIHNGYYEFVFTVNYFAVIAKVCNECGVIYVSWSCDNPLISMYHSSVFYDTNRIFLFDKTNYLEFKQMGVDYVYYLPLAVDSNRIQSILKSSKDLSLYDNEISFVGSLYERNSYDRIERELPDYLRGYFEAVIHIQSDLYGCNILENALDSEILLELEKYFKLDKTVESLSDLGLIFATTVLGFKVARYERITALNELSKVALTSIYSNSDTSVLTNVAYKGSLDYWTQMPKVFNRSHINLNFTIPNIKSGIPLRVWDILGAGGFLITNFQAELPIFFKEGEDIVYFSDKEDMVEKCRFYLKNESAREKIAKAGYEKVSNIHNYNNRLSELIDIVNKTS